MAKIVRTQQQTKESTKETTTRRRFRLSFFSKVSFCLLIGGSITSFLCQDNLIPENYKNYLNRTSTTTAVRKEQPVDVTAADADAVPTTPSKDEQETPIDNATTTTTTAATVDESSNSSNSSSFIRYDKVAIVTKVLWPTDIGHVEQWVCLINHAYNDKLKYDFIIFTTLPWSEEEIARAQKIAYPANLTVAMEGPPLEDQIDAMPQEERKFLFDRCNVQNNTNITWFHHCKDGKNTANLGYSWQSEFRAYHIWAHTALQPYKYMIWLDTDAYPSQTWKKDPMKLVVDNDLTILYAGWPYGASSNKPFQQKMMDAYNASLCEVKRAPLPDNNNDGFLIYGKMCDGQKKDGHIQQIAGNHHITNLDVFRKDSHQQFLKAFTGDYRFSRAADDQLAVTIVPLMEQYIINNRMDNDIPSKQIVWHEASHNIALRVAHHGMVDVSRKDRSPRPKKVFYNQNKDTWPGLQDRCASVFT